MENQTIQIKTTVNSIGEIITEYNSGEDDKIAVHIMRTRDQQVQDALVELGWYPPLGDGLDGLQEKIAQILMEEDGFEPENSDLTIEAAAAEGNPRAIRWWNLADRICRVR